MSVKFQLTDALPSRSSWFRRGLWWWCFLAIFFMCEPFGGTVNGQVQDLYRPSHILRVFVDLHRDKAANSFGVSDLPVIRRLEEERRDNVVNTMPGVPGAFCFAVGSDDGRKTAAEEVGKQVPVVFFKTPAFYSKENKFQDATVSKFLRIELGFQSGDPLKWGNQVAGYLSNARIGELSKRWGNATRSERGHMRTQPCGTKNIKVYERFSFIYQRFNSNSAASGGCKIPPRLYLNNLIGLHIGLTRKGFLSVGTGKNLCRRFPNHNRRSRSRKAKCKHNEEGCIPVISSPYSPKWMRWRNNGSLIGFTDAETGAPVFDVSRRDIDVSEDGRAWFHLLGPFCLSGLPENQKTKRMMSLTRQRRNRESVNLLFGSKAVSKAKPVLT